MSAMSDKLESKQKPEGAVSAPKEWFVRMSNGSMFGPINTKGLVHWACDGRIMPDDEISPDRINWQASRELEALGMDTMLERPDGTFMGPFNAKAIDPLAREGKIPPRSKRFHVSELEARIASRQPALFGEDAWDREREYPASLEERKASSLVAEEVAEGIRAGFEEQIEALQREAKDSLAEYERTIESLEVERDALKAQLAAPRPAEVNPEFDELVAECAELRARLAEVDAALARERSVDSVPKEVYERLAAECTELKQKIAETEATRASEREDLEKKLEEARELRTAQVAQQEGVIAGLTARLAEVDEALARERAIDSVPKEAYERLAMDCASLKQKHAETVATRTSERAVLQKRLEEASANTAEIQEEFTELLAFSNERDSESRDKIRQLEAELSEVTETAKTQNLVPLRRVEEAEARIAEIMRERDAIKDMLAEAGANTAIAERPAEGDIAIVKMFAEGALEMMRKTLEQEKERNTVARAISAEMQNSIHAEIERIERVLARDPGEISRAEQMEQRNERQIAKLQQELESARRHHQADMARAESNDKALEGRCKALIQKEALLREKLSRIEHRAADYDSVTSQLRRKEVSLLAAEKEFEGARQQWQIIEATLQHRIDELERGAGLLFDTEGQPRQPETEPLASNVEAKNFRVEPWMRRMKKS